MSPLRNSRAAIGLLWLGLCWVLSIAPPAAPAEQGLKKVRPQNNLVYEIFVRSFCYGGNDLSKNGNLKGVISKLDTYLNDGDPKTNHDLEVGVLWLMPICPSPTYHGYDVTDYRAINPDYGTLDDFKDLLKEAHKRGVRIIMDIPFNHSSNRHPWFKDAIKDKNSPFRSFYHFAANDGPRPGGWHQVNGADGEKLRYFGLFGANMPDVDFSNPKVRQEFKDIAKFWLDLGVDGFRLDAAKHIFGDRFTAPLELEIQRNNEWWLEFSQSVYRQNPDAILVGEILGDAEIRRRHALGLGGLIGDSFMNALRVQVSRPRPGFLGRFKEDLSKARAMNRKSFDPKLGFPDQPLEFFDFVGSHDRSPRLASDLEDMKSRGMQQSVDEAYRTAMYTLLTFSTRPILYQGDEVMQRGWKWNGNPKGNAKKSGDGSGIYDQTLREPFPWYQSGKGLGMTTWFAPRFSKPNDGASKEEQEAKGGMLDLVRGLAHLRARHPALANGDVGAILTDTEDWMVFEKNAGTDRYLVLINLTKSPGTYEFSKKGYLQYAGAQLVFWSDGTQKEWRDATNEGRYIQGSSAVPPFGLVVLRPVNNEGRNRFP